MKKYDFLQQNQSYMVRQGTIPRCLLVTGERSGDGILVNGERTGRACYTAHFPGVMEYLGAHIHELNENSVALRMLTQDQVIVMEARHVLHQYGEEGGERADFSDCYLSAIDFSDTQFNGASFRGALLEDCDLTGAGMCSCDFSEARLVHCRAQNLVAECSNFRGVSITDCDFTDARLTESDLTGLCVENTNFLGANLDFCSMENSETPGMEKTEQGSSTAPWGMSQGNEESWQTESVCPSCMAAMGMT